MRERSMLASAERTFDTAERWWNSVATQRRIATVLIALYVAGLAAVEAQRRGWLGEAAGHQVGHSHFWALHLAFTALLLTEVIGLVFGLARSVAEAAGHQFEILSLILLRSSFEELSHLPEPITWEATSAVVPKILSDAGGALAIFVLLGIFGRIQRHWPITRTADDRRSFVASKKLIALLLFAGLALIGAGVFADWLAGEHPISFFEAFYTLLIFADVLVVLISLRYGTSYLVVFRYFGFAVTTVLVRLALTAPSYYDALLGIAATGFAVLLTLAYNRAGPVIDPSETTQAGAG